MNRSTPFGSDAGADSYSFVVQFLAGLLLVAAVPVALWVLADPAAALLTVTAAGMAGLLVVGVLESPTDDAGCDC